MRVVGLNGNLQREKDIQRGGITCNRAMGTLDDHGVIPVIRRIDRLNGQGLGCGAIDIHAIMLPLVRERSRAAGFNREYRAPALFFGLANRLGRDARGNVDHQSRAISRDRTDRVA